MADINAIKISELTTITFKQLDALDQFVINDVSGTDKTTMKLPLGGLIEYIENQELVFKNGIIVNDHIKPPAGESLDIYANNIFISQSLNLDNTTDVNGLHLNKHLEDVEVVTPNTNQLLFWDDTNKNWINLTHDFIEEAPRDDRIYARKNNQWIDITDMMGGGVLDPDIGSITIQRITQGGILIDTNQQFKVVVNGDVPSDVKYEWFISTTNSSESTITNGDQESCIIVFAEAGTYTLNVRLTSDTASNSPLVSSITFNVLLETSYVLQETGSKIKLDSKLGFLIMESNEYIPPSTPVGKEVFNKSVILDKIDEEGKDSKYTEAMGIAIDRWHELVRHTNTTWDYMQSQTNEPWTDGAVLKPSSVVWPDGQIRGSIYFYTDNSSDVIAFAGAIDTMGFLNDPKGNQLCLTFAIGINERYANQSVEWWSAVMTHELGHALGINSVWGDGLVDSDLTVDGSEYVHTLEGFNLHQAIQQNRIPLEKISDEITSGHWEDNARLGVPAFVNELMISTSSSDHTYPKITSLSLGCLEDYGYDIVGSPEANPILSTRTTPATNNIGRCGGSVVFNQRKAIVIN